MFRISVITYFIALSLMFSRNVSAASWWEVQSIDTMKQSRDLAREKLENKGFDVQIDSQVLRIAETGATHIAIATPYDEEFSPFLKRWVESARRYGLKVWFRGNFSGWEGWFGYSRITRSEHKVKTAEFIDKNPDLFEDGDIFSSCPECENGGPGDPRSNGDVDGHRKFILEEYQVTKEKFKKIGKDVRSNYASMNFDVAYLIMDAKTTFEMDGLVTIDHYVATSDRMVSDVLKLRESSKGRIFFGEIGAPIPDIHGDLDSESQSQWIDTAFKKLSSISYVTGVNYWVNIGGTTRIWEDNGDPRKAVETLNKYFKPLTVEGTVVNRLNEPVANAKVVLGVKEIETDSIGRFEIPVIDAKKIIISHSDYETTHFFVDSMPKDGNFLIQKKQESLLFKLRFLLKSLFSKLR